MALYHKHRPQTFSSVIGQEHIVRTLMNQIALGRVAHAYLFSGPRGVGKTTSARVFAKALNCEKRKPGSAEPCNICTACKEISESRSIDVIEIDAASHTGVEHVRENIIENARFQPTKSPYKVFIIDEVHMLSASSFNALLKTLEEPPVYVVLILATTELEKIPGTIVSRCQRFNFKKIPHDILKTHLENVCKEEGAHVDEGVLNRIIGKSDGCARDAVSLLDQIMASGETHITADVASVVLPMSPVEDTLNFVRACVHRDVQTALAVVNRLGEDGTHFVQFADDAIQLLRAMMITRSGSQFPVLELDLSEAVKKELEMLGKSLSPAETVALIDIILRRRQEMKSSPLPQLPMELAAIEWIDRSSPKEPMMTSPEREKENSPVQKDTAPNPALPESATLTIDTVRIAWDECMLALEKASASLVFILKMADIHSVENNTITLAVEFDFHRDKIMHAPTKRLIEDTFSPIFHTTVHVHADVQPRLGTEAKKDAEIAELASLLGGESVA